MNIVRLSSLRREHSEIESQAQAWVIRLDGDELSQEDRASFAEWLSRSPVHKRLFLESARFWFDLDKLHTLVFPDEQEEVRTPARTPRPLRRFAVAAMLLLMLSAGTAWYLLPASPPAPLASEYATLVGEIRTIELTDGSTLSLNTDTRVVVLFDDHVRLIHLLRGEAVFEVASEPGRPFLVYAGRHAVRAVGTTFAMRTGGDDLDVKVLEGRIEVSSFEVPLAVDTASLRAVEAQAEVRLPLDRGQRGIFAASRLAAAEVLSLSAAGLEQSLSWREGMLIFEGDPLDVVVSEIARYTPARIEIADPTIRSLRFGGQFQVGDIGAILATLEQDFRIKVERSNDRIILSR